MFEFKPGSRWGQRSGEKADEGWEAETTEYEIIKGDLNNEKKKEFNLRGPREGKKSGTSKVIDEKKLSLAKSLFGKKK